jgi:Zn-finger protein
MKICEKCENNSKYHPSIRPDEHCIICGCTLSAKTSCLSCFCPIYKWREEMTSEQEEELSKEHEQE